jgi:hypothetical protein
MGQIINLTGQTFGRWHVDSMSHQVGKMVYWTCICECGTKRAVFGADLKRGGSLSCGCLARELRAGRMTTHGMAKEGTEHLGYRNWINARSRCNNPNDTMYHLYGGRGIHMCAQWENFAVFWADMGATWYKGASIDRIDTDGDYAPGNCKWSTPKQQANNRRNNRMIETSSGPMTVTQAAEKYGLSAATVFSRIRYGWPEADLLRP